MQTRSKELFAVASVGLGRLLSVEPSTLGGRLDRDCFIEYVVKLRRVRDKGLVE